MAAHVDVDAAIAPSFGLADELAAVDTGWHSHGRHQILYAVAGALHLEVASAQWVLPPQRAAFIRKGVPHRVRCRGVASLRTVYLADGDFDAGECCVFSVTPLAREMILHATRWGPTWTDDSEPIARSYFATLGLLAAEWLAADPWLELPRPQTADLQRAFDYALEHLDTASMEAAAKAAAVSPRTLARRFQSETQMSWRTFLRTARVLRAMAMLAEPDVNVSKVASEVGFDNVGGLSRAFRELTGESPTAFRKRVHG